MKSQSKFRGKEGGERGRVIAFGVFDGLHEGHRHFLREARKLGGRLTVAVAHDEAVVMLKGRRPPL
jgi:FAD synthetase